MADNEMTGTNPDDLMPDKTKIKKMIKKGNKLITDHKTDLANVQHEREFYASKIQKQILKIGEKRSEMVKLIEKLDKLPKASDDPSLNKQFEKVSSLMSELKSGIKKCSSHGDGQPALSSDLLLASEVSRYQWLTSMTKEDFLTLTTYMSEDLAEYKSNNCTKINKDVPTDIDIFLMGKTGNGKSATGNSILRRNAFCAKGSMESVTKDIQKECTRFQGKTINVFDTPGIHDTRMDSTSDIDEFQAKVASAFQFYPHGFHAFLMVIRYGVRFTEEDKVAIKLLKLTFGADFVKNHGILVVTCGDNFHQTPNKKTFNQWCYEEKDDCFATLFHECENRAVLFDNNTKDEKIKHLQLACLLNLVEHLCLRNYRYTNVHFDHVVLERSSLTVEAKKSMIRENMMAVISTILVDLEEAKNISTFDLQLRMLTRLKDDSANLVLEILLQDEGTKVLSEDISLVESVHLGICEEMQRCIEMNNIAELRQEMTGKFIKVAEMIAEDYSTRMNTVFEILQKFNEEKEKELKKASKCPIL